MSELFNTYLLSKKNQLTLSKLNFSNINKNLISFQNLLELKLKEFNIYNKKINLYKLNFNNKNLILNINKNLLSKNNIILNTTNENNENFINLIKRKEIISTNKNKLKNFNEYLKSININNSINKEKLFTYNQEINYNYKNINNKLFYKTYLYLFYFFISMNSLISKPIFENKPNKLIIHLFFYLFKEKNIKNIKDNNTFIKINQLKLNIISKILSQIFNKPVELDLIRLYYPYFDSNIFVNLLNILINKIQVRIIMQKFFKKAIIKNSIDLITNKNDIWNIFKNWRKINDTKISS
jgi:hypothetical protein